MKYIIKYTSGNGYTCGCCSRWDNEIFECDTLEEAITSTARIYNYPRGDGHFDEIVPIPTSPEDFVLKDGESVVNFDEDKFNEAVAKKQIVLKEEDEKRIKEEKEKEEKEKSERKERQDMLEYQRLKKKYENL